MREIATETCMTQIEVLCILLLVYLPKYTKQPPPPQKKKLYVFTYN